MIICKSISKQSTVFWGLLSVALLLLGYTVLSYCQHVRNPADTTIPSWSQLAHGVATVCTPDRKGERWIVVDSKATGFRLFLGLALGVGGAVVLGIALGCFARLGAFFNPLLSLFTKHPPTAMLAVFFVMVGTDTPMYVVMIAFGVLPCLAQAIYLSVREIPEEMINKGYTLGASSGEQILHVIVPAILPKVLDSIRLQIGPAIVFLIAAEMVVGNEGFGYRIRLQSKLLNMSVVYPYIEMLAGFGYLLDYLLRLTQARFCGWYIRKDSETMLTMHDRDIVLECRHLCKTIEGKKILHDVDFQLVRGSFLGLVGPSGSGKSTLLRAILGTHPACCGEVALHFGNADGTTQIVTNPNRHIGIVYQRYSLFDWLTARENVAFGPMLDLTSIPFRIFRPFTWRRMRKAHLKEAGELLEKLRLDKQAIDSLPAQLSGGMRQRVAIGQALTNKPLLLLLDEPFGALDEDTREGMQRIMLRLYAENIEAIDRGEEPPYTVVLVTHELNEALLICDRVVALSQYWNWHEQGFDQCPGATIVYDKTTPVFQLEEERDFSIFASQRDEIRRVGFDPNTITRVDEFRQFWTQIKDGQGRRVLSNCNSAPKADAPA